MCKGKAMNLVETAVEMLQEIKKEISNESLLLSSLVLLSSVERVTRPNAVNLLLNDEVMSSINDTKKIVGTASTITGLLLLAYANGGDEVLNRLQLKLGGEPERTRQIVEMSTRFARLKVRLQTVNEEMLEIMSESNAPYMTSKEVRQSPQLTAAKAAYDALKKEDEQIMAEIGSLYKRLQKLTGS